MIEYILYGISRIIPFGYVEIRREDDGNFEHIVALALAYETGVK